MPRGFSGNGDPHMIDPQAVAPDFGASTLAFVPRAMPAPGRIAAGIEIDVTVGFGDEAEDVPEIPQTSNPDGGGTLV